MQQERSLARNLKNRHIQLIAIGGAIGTGLFLGSGRAIHLAGPSILLAYIITGIICFLIMRALGELLLSNTNYHSFVAFVYDYLGKRAAFITGWTYWFCWICIAMADLTAVGLYVSFWFPSVPQWLPGLLALILLLVMNLATVKLFGEMEFWFALIKIIAILALIITGIILISVHKSTSTGYASISNLYSHGGFFPNGFHGFILSFQMVVFAFVGIELVGLTAGETENPEQTLPKAINNIPLRILIFYIGALFVIMCVYPWNKISLSESPFVQVFITIGVTAAAGIVNFIVLTSAASACNSAVFSTSRMIYSLALEKNAPQTLSKLNKRHVPAKALYFSVMIIFVVIALNYLIPNAETIFTLISSISTVCFIYIWMIIVICHYKYKRSKMPTSTQPSFKLPFYPVSNCIILLFLAAVIVILALAPATRIALFITPIWFLMLFIIYSFIKKEKSV